VDWGFNAWGGKYPPWDADDAVPTRVGAALGLPVFQAPIVMEGGAIDVNGEGTLLTTTSCLLNKNRNPGVSKAEIEDYLRAWYGQRHIVWLGEGIAGDDTDGHVDDLARFVDARTIVTAVEPDTADDNFKVLRDNRKRLDKARDADGRPFTIVELPMPTPVVYEGQRLPATYVNFLFVNGGLLVPTFGDRVHDRQALSRLQALMPGRRVVGVDCRALIWGLGAIHCLTQQQPRTSRPRARPGPRSLTAMPCGCCATAARTTRHGSTRLPAPNASSISTATSCTTTAPARSSPRPCSNGPARG
jgi:agmatine deiminase